MTTSRTPRGHRWVLALVAVLLSACGGNDADEGSRGLAGTGAASTTTTTSDEVVSAYRDWLTALADHDAGAACLLQAPDYTIQLRSEAILAHRAELGDPCVDFEALVWEDPAFDDDVTDIEITQRTAEDALLEVHLDSRALTVRMVYDRAHWRVLSTTDRTDDGTTAGATTGPARWVAVWCDLSPDQTREEIIDAMGQPSGEYTVSDGGEPQLWWAQDQYDFRVYLDPIEPGGSVLELVGDYDALGAADRAQLPCPELRS